MSKAGKTALITGGASGIGAATAIELAKRGWRVAVADLNVAEIRPMADTDDDNFMALKLDVRNAGDARDACDAIVQRWGRLDLLVNNAGVARSAPLESFKIEDWSFVFDVHVTGTLLCMQAAAKHMLPARSGVIVNTASIAGVRGVPGRAAYAAAKAAIISLTKSAAVEWAKRGIRVNAIAPGYTDTPLVRSLIANGSVELQPMLDMTPMGRLAATEEIARVTSFLGSDDSSFVTGQVVFVDGGYTAEYGLPSLFLKEAKDG